MSSKRGKEAVEKDFEAFVRHRVLFYDYFHHEKFPNIPVSLVSELHNITVPAVHHPIKLQYLYFELILGDFASALLEVSFGTIFRNPLETNHLKKCLKKHFHAGTWFNTNESISLL